VAVPSVLPRPSGPSEISRSADLFAFSPQQLSKEGRWYFGTLPQELRMSEDISDAAKVMYSALAQMEATMPEVRPSLERLRKEVGKSRSATIRALNELKAKKLIEVTEHPQKGVHPLYSTNVYRFLLNPDYLPKTFENVTGIPGEDSVKNDTGVKNGTSVKNGPELVPKMTLTQCQKRYPSKNISKARERDPGDPLLTKVVKACSERIHGNHPPRRRDVSSAKVEKLLIAIIMHKKLSREKAIAFTRDLTDRHERWCRCEQWTTNDGQYAKGLENWLAPTKERYEAEPNDQQGNRDGHAHNEPRGLKVGEIE
jgi:hypothetical protein